VIVNRRWIRIRRDGFVGNTRLRRFVWYRRDVRRQRRLFAEGHQILEGALKHGVEAGFVAVEKVEAVVGSEVGEGGHQPVGVAGSLLGGHGGIEVAVFDGPGAADAPEVGDHFVDHIGFDIIERAEAAGVLVAEFVECLIGFVLEDDDSGEETVPGGVPGRAGLALGSFGASGQGSVGAGCGDSFFGRHDGSPLYSG
jgi:hypothetical protein